MKNTVTIRGIAFTRAEVENAMTRMNEPDYTLTVPRLTRDEADALKRLGDFEQSVPELLRGRDSKHNLKLLAEAGVTLACRGHLSNALLKLAAARITED